MGCLGVGWIGLQRLDAIRESGLADIVAVGDEDGEAAHKACEHIQNARSVGSLAELLDAELDGVVIATPSALHASQAREALARGVAVFCQKPLGLNTSEAQAVVDAARCADRLLEVDFSYRGTEALQKVFDLIRSEALGRVFAANLVFHNAYGPGKEWYYQRHLSGGGCVMDLGIHLVDAALWLLGSPVRRVSSRIFAGGISLESAGTETEDFAVARLDFDSGASAQLACSWNLNAGRGAQIEMAFYGERGGAIMHNVDGSFYDFAAEHFIGTDRQVLVTPPDNWAGRMAVDWVRRLAAGGRYEKTANDLLARAEVIDLIYSNCTIE